MAGRVYETAIRIRAALASTFKSVTGDAAKSLEKLTEQSKKLTAANEAAKAFAKLQGELRELEKRQAASAAGTKEARAATRAIERKGVALSKAGARLQKFGVDTAKLSTEQARLQKELAETKRQAESLERIASARKRLFGDGRKDPQPLIPKIGGQIRGVVSDVAKLAAVGGAAGVGLVELVRRAAEHGDAIGDASARTDIGVEKLQELHFAAKLAGASTEDLEGGLGKLAVNIGKVISAKKKGGASFGMPGDLGDAELLTKLGGGGGAGALDPFAKVGLSAQKLAKLKPDQQIAEIAEALNKLPTHAERAAAATALLGKAGGLKLLPMLAEGRKGLEAAGAEARALGGVLGAEAVENAQKFGDAMDASTTAAKGVALVLGSELLPVATDVLKQFAGWVKENRQQIVRWAKDSAKWIKDEALPWIRRVAPEFLKIVSRVADLVRGAASLAGGWGNLGIVLAALRLAPLAGSLLQVAGTIMQVARATGAWKVVQWALNAAMMANPIGLIILGVALLTGAIITLIAYWKELKQQMLGFMLGDFGQKVMKFIPGGEGLASIVDENRSKLVAEHARLTAKIDDQKARGRGDVTGHIAELFDPGGGGAGAAPNLESVVKRLNPAPASAAGGAGGKVDIQFAPSVSIQGGTREEVERRLDEKLEELKAKLLAEFDARVANKRRLAFG